MSSSVRKWVFPEIKYEQTDQFSRHIGKLPIDINNIDIIKP